MISNLGEQAAPEEAVIGGSHLRERKTKQEECLKPMDKRKNEKAPGAGGVDAEII